MSSHANANALAWLDIKLRIVNVSFKYLHFKTMKINANNIYALVCVASYIITWYVSFQSSQQDGQKQESKDDMGNNESDIEFVETGPQVIEIPDANDSR